MNTEKITGGAIIILLFLIFMDGFVLGMEVSINKTIKCYEKTQDIYWCLGIEKPKNKEEPQLLNKTINALTMPGLERVTVLELMCNGDLVLRGKVIANDPFIKRFGEANYCTSPTSTSPFHLFEDVKE